MNNENNVLTIKTVQIAPFRTLMTALKDILLETNIMVVITGIVLIKGFYILKNQSKLKKLLFWLMMPMLAVL